MSTLSYALACATGLSYNEQTCSGLLHGYRVSAMCENSSETYRDSPDMTKVILYFSVSNGTGLLDEKRFTGLADSSSNIKSITLKDNMLQIVCESRRKSEKETAQIAAAAMKEMVDFLQHNGFYSCCARCGASDKETDSYAVGKSHICLCKECAQRESVHIQEEKPKRNWKNVLLGILGAVLLLSVGAVINLLLYGCDSLFGLCVPIILGLCAVLGYKWFGKGITGKDIPILIVLLLVFVCLTHQALWAMDAAYYWETSFLEEYGYILTAPPSEYLVETSGYWEELITAIVMSCLISVIMAAVLITKEKDKWLMRKV